MDSRRRSGADAVAGEVVEDVLVGFPAVGEFGVGVEVDGFVEGVVVQQAVDAGAGDDDAGVPVA